MPTGAIPLGSKADPKKRKDYKPLGTCVVCGAAEIEVDAKKRCHLCKGDVKADGVVPAFKTKDDEDDTMYLN